MDGSDTHPYAGNDSRPGENPRRQCCALLRKELPLILLDEDFDARLQLFDVIFLEESHVALDSIVVINSFFLHQPIVAFVPSNQH
jgi:hypothetical protein